MRAAAPAMGEAAEAAGGDDGILLVGPADAAGHLDRAARLQADDAPGYGDLGEALGEAAEHIDAGSADALRVAVAYVAGMTDRFAEQDYRKLFDPTERV